VCRKGDFENPISRVGRANRNSLEMNWAHSIGCKVRALVMFKVGLTRFGLGHGIFSIGLELKLLYTASLPLRLSLNSEATTHPSDATIPNLDGATFPSGATIISSGAATFHSEAVILYSITEL
jgi:hypothetical protein